MNLLKEINLKGGDSLAERRMFSIKIIDSARFLKMPVMCQNLYFHMCIRADDDGVVEGYNVIKMLGASEDDLNVLADKGFITVLNEDLVVYINDWQEHNHIRPDRKTDSIYKNLLLKVLPDLEVVQKRDRADKKNGRQMDVQRTAQVRLGKDRLGKVSLGKDRSDKDRKEKTVCVSEPEKEMIDFKGIKDYFNQYCTSFPKVTEMTKQRKEHIRDFLKNHSEADLYKLFDTAQESDFLTGTNRSWKANFDWIIKPENAIKIFEGNYQNKQDKKVTTGNSNLDVLAKWANRNGVDGF
ncbi:MAG: hypothetical protein LKJ13_02280 [Clostridia bacterium]|nr:hypothetical protein [Clostridia bacterium]